MPIPGATRFVIIGAGFAGSATAAALARAGAGPGVLLEREDVPGFHASGRNAGIARALEFDPSLRELAVEGLQSIVGRAEAQPFLFRKTGGYYLCGAGREERLQSAARDLSACGVAATVLTASEARRRHPRLAGIEFDLALFCPGDGIVDVHGLLTDYLAHARAGGFLLTTRCEVIGIGQANGRVVSVSTTRGEIACEVVIDASGAWAGRLGREAPLGLTPTRRHLFVSAALPGASRDEPIVWDLDAAYYFRGEGDGLLLSPCDETAHPPEPPPTDPAALLLLADKLQAHAPALADLGIRRGWACLRTFAPDREPVIGPDPEIAGLFHVSGLGGFGMSASAAVGRLAAAAILAGDSTRWRPARLLRHRASRS